MTTAAKPRTRLAYVGQATFRRVQPDKGWRGTYGQTRWWAIWACIDCGARVSGTDEAPSQWASEKPCARNGHAPCRLCGQMLPRLDDGCPREHRWTSCPGKTEVDRMQPQHAHKGHLAREGGTA